MTLSGMATESSNEQLANADALMLVTPTGMMATVLALGHFKRSVKVLLNKIPSALA